MSFRIPQPTNEDDFELFCLRLLRELWGCPGLQQYGKRGERQFGIDLIDEGGIAPLRAVQCKHHEPDKTIPPAEIESEVAKALVSELPLDEYYILTTARKTTHGQNAVIRINRAHQAAGDFKLFVWTWSDIEERLSQLDDATQDRIIRGDSGRGGPALCRLMTGVMTDHLDRPLYASASVLDLKLELAKGFVDRHQLEVAESKLNELESEALDKLQPHHSFQLKVLRSRIYSDRWQWTKAGEELLDAKRFAPDLERARINEALGYELIGNKEKAHALATALRAEFPRSARLMAIWARSAPDNISANTIIESASLLAKDDEELNLALSFRAMAEDQFDVALPYALRATELDVESPHAWFVLGLSKHSLGYHSGPGHQKATLREAEEHYTKAAGIAQDHKLSGLEAAIRFNRGKVRHVLGRSDADSDFAAAIEIRVPDSELRMAYVSYLLEMGRYDDALRQLSLCDSKQTVPRLFYEAAAYFMRNVGDDRTRAIQLLGKAISSEPCERWADAHILLVQRAVEDKDTKAAEELVDGSKLRETNPLVFHTLIGWLSNAEGKAETAKANYIQAHSFLTDATPRDQVFILAQALASTDDDVLAMPLFLRCYRLGVFNFECRKLLGCAQRLQRHDVSSRICRELREAGEADPRIVLTEIQILQMYDPQEAMRVAAEYLSNHPDDRHIALWQSTLSIRLNQPERMISEVSRLPTPEEITPEGTGLVLNVLKESGQHSAALRYAYDSLRVHYDTEFAHGQFVAWFLQLSEHCPELHRGGAAHPSMAIRYFEERDGSERWLVIEDADDPDLARGELGPDHPVSKALAGRQVGETVELPDGGIQPREVTIREVLHKYIYRFRDCMDQFQIRFSGASAIQVVHVGTGDGADFSPIIKSLEEQKKHIDDLDEVYRKQPLALYTYAKAAGRDEFAAWSHLASRADLGLKCCNEQVDDMHDAQTLVSKTKRFVLDLTTLNTLAQLDLLKVLRNPSHSYVVTQTICDRLADLVESAEYDQRSPGTVYLRGDGQLGFSDISLEQRGKFKAFLTGIQDAILSSCHVLPCPQAAALDPIRRDQYIELFGRHNLDSMLLASEPETTLWSDDMTLGIACRSEFKATRVWTQVVLFAFLNDGTISNFEFNHAIAKLVGWHYHGMQCNADTLIGAAEVAQWDMSRWPITQVMQTLGAELSSSIQQLSAAATAIRAVWHRALSDTIRQDFLFAVLNGIGSPRKTRYLARLIPQVFFLDVNSAFEVVRLIHFWLQFPTGKQGKPITRWLRS